MEGKMCKSLTSKAAINQRLLHNSLVSLEDLQKKNRYEKLQFDSAIKSKNPFRYTVAMCVYNIQLEIQYIITRLNIIFFKYISSIINLTIHLRFLV